MARKKKADISTEAVLAELSARNAAPAFDINKFCFKEQLDAVSDPADFAIWLTSRRSGKTLGCVSDMINEVHKRPGTVALYVTLSRSSAKKLIWPEALKIDREYKLGGVPNIADLSITFPNGSVIYFSGAKNKGEIDKFRGLPLVIAYVDEAQSFGPHLEELVDDVISKALYDYNGKLRLMGTPPPVPTGYFIDIWNSSTTWSKHSWDMRSNPWLLKKSGKTPMQLIERDLKRKGVTIDDPSIQRECFGRLVMDLDSLVFRYDKAKNHYETLPDVKGAGEWHHVVGCDLGYDDADAIAVLAYHDNLPGVYLVEEITRTKQTITDFANMLGKVIETYKPHSIVLDAGGLGKKINEELNRRFSLPIKAAEKSRKFEYIALLNDALRTQKFFARQDGQFARDAMLVELDREKSRDGRLVVSDKFHSDITDATLYAYRESLHFLAEPLQEKIAPGSGAWYLKQKEEMEQMALDALEESKRDTSDPGSEHITKVWRVDDN